MTENFDDRRVYWIWLSLLFGAGVSSFWKLCRGYERCFHKENPYVNPFVKDVGLIGEIVN